jgi:hypothetical protein
MTAKTDSAPAPDHLQPVPSAQPPSPPPSNPRSSRRLSRADDDICFDPRGAGGPEHLIQRALEGERTDR